MAIKWVHIDITNEEIAAQLMAQGQVATSRQITEIADRILENIKKHDIKRELIGRAIKDIGIINLKKLG